MRRDTLTLFDDLRQDVWYALRTMARNPSFTVPSHSGRVRSGSARHWALGAPTSSAFFLRRSVAMTAIGIVLSLGGAAAVTRSFEGMLFGLTPLDASTFIAVSLIFAMVATLASYIPARRATKVDPIVAIRCE